MDTKVQPLRDLHTETLSGALTAIAGTLETDAATATAQIGEILAAIPGQPQAMLLLASAFRVLGETAAALEILELLVQDNPQIAAIRFELALQLGKLGKHREAVEHLRKVVDLEFRHPAAWRALGNELACVGDGAGAGEAYARHVRVSLSELKLIEDAMGPDDDLDKAEKMLRQYASVHPTDVSTLHMLAQVGLRQDRLADCRPSLERALDLAPDFHAARLSYATVLGREHEWTRAIDQLDIVLRAEPDNSHAHLQKAWNLVMIGEYDKAQHLYEAIRSANGDRAPFWLDYGHYLRTIGRSREAVDAYRRCTELDPSMGLAWWALANLKTYKFSPAEMDVMRRQIREGSALSAEQLVHIEFAFGAALETSKDYDESFVHYRQGNVLRRSQVQYDADESDQRIERAKAFFTREFFAAHSGMGCSAPDPVFIVGMPRAGSTLIEQVLASHSQVEGTAELPDVANIIGELRDRFKNPYPALLKGLDAAEFKALGQRYLDTTRIQRKSSRPFFTDKSPQNFLSVGFIHLILPNAKIIDARRHPLSCCFSGYKQCFTPGAMPHTYDLSEIGRYYRNYVELMAHFDAVLPGRVLRVFHESMVRDPDTEIRRILAYCGLPFEAACLSFHTTERGVRTSSSEQVRRPITVEPVEAWTRYDAWLEPLKDALGDALVLYPDVPAFDRVPKFA
jgi:tetratricopeptide (TPR) repeat protein